MLLEVLFVVLLGGLVVGLVNHCGCKSQVGSDVVGNKDNLGGFLAVLFPRLLLQVALGNRSVALVQGRVNALGKCIPDGHIEERDDILVTALSVYGQGKVGNCLAAVGESYFWVMGQSPDNRCTQVSLLSKWICCSLWG